MRTGLAAGLVALGVLTAGTAAAQNIMVPQTFLAQADNQFAVDVYGKLSQQPGNFVFSPFSVANALDMVFLGAKGATADEIADVLHLQSDGSIASHPELVQATEQRNIFPPTYGPNVPVSTDGFQFEDADALWGAKGEKFEPAYLTNVKVAFRGNFFPVDFRDAAAAAAKISGWVAGKTHGLITGLISPEAITPKTKLVLTDAVYFKAGWDTDFDPAASKPGLFHAASGQDVTLRMMHQTGRYTMTRGDGMEMLDIPYRHYDASLLIILPDARDGLPAVESELSAEKLTDWLVYGQQFNVTVSLPAFKTESSFDLAQMLQALGMKRAFQPFQADLSLIADDTASPLYISDVVHKASIDVEEKGTVAAAATGVMMVESLGIEPPIEDVTFTADHPFIYVIRANGSGDILFMGRVETPDQSGG